MQQIEWIKSSNILGKHFRQVFSYHQSKALSAYYFLIHNLEVKAKIGDKLFELYAGSWLIQHSYFSYIYNYKESLLNDII